jgi:hypothetical protein
VRHSWTCVIVLSLMVACRDPSPTAPTIPELAQFSISVTVENPGSLSLSEPVLCPGDAPTCPRGPQTQGPVSSNVLTVRDYALAPGTYRLTGVVRPRTSIEASVGIRFGGRGTTGIRGGVIREAPVLGFVAFTGEPMPPWNSVVSEVCGARFFANSSGALEWSVTFRSTTMADSIHQLCP